jgi:hypothetical protein
LSAKSRRIDFVADLFISGVSGQLTREDLGVYWVICSLIYSHGGPIKNDPKWISRIFKDCNSRAIRASVERLMIANKVQENDGLLMANGCEKAIKHSQNRAETYRKNGHEGGRPSNGNNTLDKPSGFKPLPPAQIIAMPKSQNGVMRNEADAKFDILWSIYPHKVGKPAARKAFPASLKAADFDEIKAGLELYIKTKPPERAWLNLSTFFNQQRWADRPGPLFVGAAQTADQDSW